DANILTKEDHNENIKTEKNKKPLEEIEKLSNILSKLVAELNQINY
ncbi:15101_t:CDS:1, partial [Dentiscutata heterogama]